MSKTQQAVNGGRPEQADVLVIGGGAAGMMAACAAAGEGRRVVLLERNEKLGKKIYITGKGRCNFTNVCPPQEFLENISTNARFLYSAIWGFDPQAAVDWFESRGMSVVTERGNRAFPASYHASDVTAALEREMRRLGVSIRLHARVAKILTGEDIGAQAEAGVKCAQPENGTKGAHDAGPETGAKRAHGAQPEGGTPHVCGVQLEDGTKICAGAVIAATGGLAYPSTGSTGDGYRFARECGHEVTALSPSLVPMETAESDIPALQGLSLRNVTLTVSDGKRKLFEDFGEMLFTHFGVTGPLVLRASSRIQQRVHFTPEPADADGKRRYVPDRALHGEIDLKSALDEETLDRRILREFSAAPNRNLGNVIAALYPSKLQPVMLERAGLDAEKKVHEVTREERMRLVRETRHFPFTITALRDFSEAVVTHGGVSVKQVDPGTMESKLVKGLYFAGEVLDVDGYTGGFSLQIAWATGRAAGLAAAAQTLLRNV